jgi:hypothetical protein
MSEIKWVRACDGLLVRLDRVVAVKAAPNGAVVHLSTGQRLETTARVEDIAMQITDASADDRTRRKRAEPERPRGID